MRQTSRAGIVVLVIVAAACSSSAKKSSPPLTTTTTTPAVTAPATTSPGSVATTTTAAAPTGPEDVAKAFFAGWSGGNDGAMTANGNAAAVAAAKAGRAAGTSGFRFSNCQGAAGTVFCTFVKRGARVQLGVDNVDVPHKVTQFKRDALDSETTAAEFLNAWQAGSADAVAALSGAAAATQAATLRSHAQSPWSLDNCQGAAGSTYCTYKAGTSKLVVRVVQVNPPPIVGELQFTP